MSFLGETFTAFQVRNFKLLWSGSLFSTTAFMMSFMLVPSLAFEISGNNTAAGLAQLGSGVGMFLVAPIGGVIADRVRKKPIVLIGQAVPGLVILATGLLIVTDMITIPLLMLGTLIMGFGFAFMGPARQAWVGELVPQRLLPNAVALQQIAMNIAQVAGPLLIAILVGTALGIGGTYIFMASLFVVVMPLTSLIPNTPPSVSPEQRRSVRIELTAGVRYVVGDPRLRTLWLSFVGLVVCGFAFQTLLPGLLDKELGREPTDIGLIFLAFAIAGLVVNVPLANLVRTRFAWPVLLGMGLLMAAGFWILAAAPTYQAAIFMGIPLGIGRSGFMLMNNSLLMSTARPMFYGRVMSLTMMAFGTQALLAPVWGVLADSIGVRETLFAVGVIAAVMVAMTTIAWLRLRALPPSPGGAFDTAPAEETAPTPAPAPTPVAAPRPLAAAQPQPAPLQASSVLPPPAHDPARAAIRPLPSPLFEQSRRPRKREMVVAASVGVALGLTAVVQRNASQRRADLARASRRVDPARADQLRRRVQGWRARLADWVEPPP